MQNRLKNIFILVLLILSVNACTKEVITAADHDTDIVSKQYAATTPADLYQKSTQVLVLMGYTFATADEVNQKITTVWRATTSGSHYLFIFGRRDYSAAMGAYYQLTVTINPVGNANRVDVKTTIKNLAGKLTSSHQIENEFFKKLDDAVRTPNIKMTNVGISNQ